MAGISYVRARLSKETESRKHNTTELYRTLTPLYVKISKPEVKLVSHL